MSIFKQANPLISLVGELLAAAGIEHGAEAIAGSVVGKLESLKGSAGADQGSKDLVVQNEVLFNQLVNQIKASLSSIGVQPNQIPSFFSDPEKLFDFFRENYSVNAKDDLNEILAGLIPMIQSIPGNYLKADPNLIQKVLDFVFKFYKRTNYNKQEAVEKLKEFTQQMASGDPFVQMVCIQQLNGNFAGASFMAFLNKIGKDNINLQDVQKITQTANQMLGAQSPELLDAQSLMDAKNRTTFDFLKESKDLFKLTTPIAKEKEHMVQSFYGSLDSFFGTQTAKEIMNSPIGTFLMLSAGYTQGKAGLTSGATSALRGK
jgi:hypothetical protein